jgi:predicted nucleic acid-binding Zn ribbon protein
MNQLFIRQFLSPNASYKVIKILKQQGKGIMHKGCLVLQEVLVPHRRYRSKSCSPLEDSQSRRQSLLLLRFLLRALYMIIHVYEYLCYVMNMQSYDIDIVSYVLNTTFLHGTN